MNMVAAALAVAAELVIARRLRRCVHRLVEMTDGPVCRDCGRFWAWQVLNP